MRHNLSLQNGKYGIYNLSGDELKSLNLKLKREGLRHRADYMNREISHREYFAQFVYPYLKELLKGFIGLHTLLASTDEHLNDISLRHWDALPRPSQDTIRKLSLCGDWLSESTHVCIYKEAARQLIEESQNDQ